MAGFFFTNSVKSPDSSTGVANEDQPKFQPEQQIHLPWIDKKEATFLEYQCWVEVRLDAGMALHKPLPQRTTSGAIPPDTLASATLSPLDTKLDERITGINTQSFGGYEDIIQKMATSDYLFMLRGYSVRAGYQTPVPGLVSIAGVPAIPAERQFARSVIIANFCGIPIFLTNWDLWYYVALPPKSDVLPPPNLAMHISADQKLPKKLTVPISPPDSNSVQTNVLRRRLLR